VSLKLLFRLSLWRSWSTVSFEPKTPKSVIGGAHSLMNKRHVPVHSVTEETAEIAGMISGELAAKGVVLPMDDLLIGASAVEQGYAVATLNLRHFQKIPDLKVLSI
jgi:hypothetical protein